MSHQVLQLSVYNPSPIRLFRRRVIMPSPQTLRQYSTIILKKKYVGRHLSPPKKKREPLFFVCVLHLPWGGCDEVSKIDGKIFIFFLCTLDPSFQYRRHSFVSV